MVVVIVTAPRSISSSSLRLSNSARNSGGTGGPGGKIWVRGIHGLSVPQQPEVQVSRGYGSGGADVSDDFLLRDASPDGETLREPRQVKILRVKGARVGSRDLPSSELAASPRRQIGAGEGAYVGADHPVEENTAVGTVARRIDEVGVVPVDLDPVVAEASGDDHVVDREETPGGSAEDVAFGRDPQSVESSVRVVEVAHYLIRF